MKSRQEMKVKFAHEIVVQSSFIIVEENIFELLDMMTEDNEQYKRWRH